MADNGRGGGAGWFIMGLLIGVAGTLVTQKFVQSGGQASQNASAASAPSAAAPAVAATAASDAKPKLVMHQGGLSGARPASAAAVAITQSPDDIADDAAAAGATSRGPRTTPPTN